MAVDTLRPTSTDALTGWEANPHLKLDEVVTSADTDALSASGEYVATTTNGHTFTIGFGTFTLGTDVVSQVKAWSRWRGTLTLNLITSGLGTIATVSISSGGTVTTSSATYTGALTQTQIDDLQVQVNSTATQSPNARVGWIFIEVTHAAGGGTDLTVTPGTPNVDWAGSTPGVKADISRTPGTPNVAWSGSTPGLLVDKSLSPGTPNVDWAGSTPAVVVDKSLAPGTPVVAWSGSTPSLVMEGEVTLSPGAGVVVWSGSTPALVVTPDVVVEAPSQGGRYEPVGDDEDASTEETRNLTLTPGPAVVAWSGSTPALRVVDGPRPFRIRLPKRRQEAAPVPVEAPRVVDLALEPRAAVVAYTGSPAPAVIESFVPLGDYEALRARVAELEREREEETIVLAALSRG